MKNLNTKQHRTTLNNSKNSRSSQSEYDDYEDDWYDDDSEDYRDSGSKFKVKKFKETKARWITCKGAIAPLLYFVSYMIRFFAAICVFMVVGGLANPVLGGIVGTAVFFLLK